MDTIIIPQWKSNVEAAHRSIELIKKVLAPEDPMKSMLTFIGHTLSEMVSIAEKADIEMAQLPWANDDYGRRLRQAMFAGFKLDKSEARALIEMIAERFGIPANFTSITQDQLKLLVGAAIAVEQWWLGEEMHKGVGAPGCMFALRAAIEELRKA